MISEIREKNATQNLLMASSLSVEGVGVGDVADGDEDDRYDSKSKREEELEGREVRWERDWKIIVIIEANTFVLYDWIFSSFGCTTGIVDEFFENTYHRQ